MRLGGTVLTAAQARRSNRQPARDIIKVNKGRKKKRVETKWLKKKQIKFFKPPTRKKKKKSDV